MHAQIVYKSHSYGIKRPGPLTEKLRHFDILSGYLFDLLHDLCEYFVPLELHDPCKCIVLFVCKCHK